MSGFFFTFEGIDKSGKTTQAELLVDRLRRADCEVVFTHEPGGTALGQAIRALVVEGKIEGEICDEAEVLLFTADRCQHVWEVECWAPLAIVVWILVFGIRIAALDHESWNHSVKLRPIIESSLRSGHEVHAMQRGIFRKEPNLDRSQIGHQPRLDFFEFGDQEAEPFVDLFHPFELRLKFGQRTLQRPVFGLQTFLQLGQPLVFRSIATSQQKNHQPDTQVDHSVHHERLLD